MLKFEFGLKTTAGNEIPTVLSILNHGNYFFASNERVIKFDGLVGESITLYK